MMLAASKLVQVFLELKHRIRTTAAWANPYSRPASLEILYQQFVALARQLGIPLAGLHPPEAVRYFESGAFISQRTVASYQAIRQELEAFEPELEAYRLWKLETYQHWQLTNLFAGLLGFKLATDFRYFGALEGLEVGGAYAHSLALGALGPAAVQRVDSLLALLIDPGQLPLNLSEVAGYPAADYEAAYLRERLDEETGP